MSVLFLISYMSVAAGSFLRTARNDSKSLKADIEKSLALLDEVQHKIQDGEEILKHIHSDIPDDSASFFSSVPTFLTTPKVVTKFPSPTIPSYVWTTLVTLSTWDLGTDLLLQSTPSLPELPSYSPKTTFETLPPMSYKPGWEGWTSTKKRTPTTKDYWAQFKLLPGDYYHTTRRRRNRTTTRWGWRPYRRILTKTTYPYKIQRRVTKGISYGSQRLRYTRNSSNNKDSQIKPYLATRNISTTFSLQVHKHDYYNLEEDNTRKKRHSNATAKPEEKSDDIDLLRRVLNNLAAHHPHSTNVKYVRKITGSSSYSDEEASLKINLLHHLLHFSETYQKKAVSKQTLKSFVERNNERIERKLVTMTL